MSCAPHDSDVVAVGTEAAARVCHPPVREGSIASSFKRADRPAWQLNRGRRHQDGVVVKLSVTRIVWRNKPTIFVRIKADGAEMFNVSISPAPLEFFRALLHGRNSPEVLSRLVKAALPITFDLRCVRFLNAPLRALSRTGLFIEFSLNECWSHSIFLNQAGVRPASVVFRRGPSMVDRSALHFSNRSADADRRLVSLCSSARTPVTRFSSCAGMWIEVASRSQRSRPAPAATSSISWTRCGQG